MDSSDSPTLPADCLRAAFAELDNADVTLGTCTMAVIT
jgi:glycosyltransferase A (GT-A) superfamily protein (DUF2064 family)